MLFLSIILYIFCLLLFFAIYYERYGLLVVFSPIVAFAGFDMVSLWGASVYYQSHQLLGRYYSDIGIVFLISTSFCMLLLGYGLWIKSVHNSAELPGKFIEGAVCQDFSEGVYAIQIFILLSVLFATNYYMYNGMPLSLKFLCMLIKNGNYHEATRYLSKMREIVGKGYYFGGEYRGQGVILTLNNILCPYMLAFAGLLYLKTKKKVWLAAFVSLLIISIIYVGGRGARFPIIKLFVFLVILKSLLGKIHLKESFKYTLVLIIVASAVIALKDVNSPTEALEKLNKRIFLGDGENTIEVINFIRDGSLEIRGGRIHYEKFLSAFPGVTRGTPFSYEVQMLRRPLGSGTSFASMNYLGILYADFGYMGPLLGYFFIGIAAALFELFIYSRKKQIIVLPALALLVSFFGELSISSSISVGASIFMLSIVHIWILYSMKILTLIGRELNAYRDYRSIGFRKNYVNE